jgi:hypothetical protein
MQDQGSSIEPASAPALRDRVWVRSGSPGTIPTPEDQVKNKKWCEQSEDSTKATGTIIAGAISIVSAAAEYEEYNDNSEDEAHLVCSE